MVIMNRENVPDATGKVSALKSMSRITCIVLLALLIAASAVFAALVPVFSSKERRKMEKFAGTYRKEGSPSEYLRLASDGTYVTSNPYWKYPTWLCALPSDVWHVGKGSSVAFPLVGKEYPVKDGRMIVENAPHGEGIWIKSDEERAVQEKPDILKTFFTFKVSPANLWETVVTPGSWFRDNSRASSMAVYDNRSGEKLYVGTSNDAEGCEVRSYDGKKWIVVGTNGIGNPQNKEALSMVVFKSKLYVGTRNSDGCEVRRYDGGTTWTRVSKPGFGAGKANTDATSMVVFRNDLYACTWSSGGFDLYRSSDGITWEVITQDGFGNPSDNIAASMAVYDDGSGSKLYVGTVKASGCNIYRYDFVSKSAMVVGRDGLGDSGNDIALSLAVYKSKLYVGTHNNKGCQVRRFDGEDKWTEVNENGFGNTAANKEVSSLFVLKSGLYAGTGFGPGVGFIDSCEILRTDAQSGATYEWTKENVPGFADDFNRGARSWAVYKNKLYIGTWNTDEGCGIYRVGKKIMAPKWLID